MMSLRWILNYLLVLFIVAFSLSNFAAPTLSKNSLDNYLKKNNLTGRFNKSSCTGNGSTAMCIAVGFAAQSDLLLFPLLVQSTDGGQTFSVVNSITNFSKQGTLLTASCSRNGHGNICVAAGYLGPIKEESTPYLIQSQDHGATWQTISTADLPSTGFFRKVSCTGQGVNATCVAVGLTLPIGQSFPIIYQSTNGGKTWSAQTANNYGDLTSISCVDSAVSRAICVAIGHDINNVPLIIQTTDGGNTWTNKPYLFLKKSLHDLSLIFSDVSCVIANAKKYCVVVGQIGTTTKYNPVFFETKDGQGANWVRNTDVAFPMNWIGGLSAVSCTTVMSVPFCVATGQQIPSPGSFSAPLLMQSFRFVDGNAWWVKIINGADSWNNLLANTCTNNFCFAVGEDRTLWQPKLAQSNTNFSNWSAQNVTNSLYAASVRSASCNDSASICIATGYILGSDIENDTPLIIANTGAGNTWQTANIAFTPAVKR